jgi:hypothetical protein
LKNQHLLPSVPVWPVLMESFLSTWDKYNDAYWERQWGKRVKAQGKKHFAPLFLAPSLHLKS